MRTAKPTRRQLFATAGLLALSGLVYGVWDAGNDSAAPPANNATAITGGQAVGHRYSTRSWSLDYDSLRASNDSTFIEATGIRNGTIYRNGKPAMRAAADRATINLVTKDFDIEGHVHITATFGATTRTFDTTGATWSQMAGKLVMPGKIKIGGQGATLTIAGATVEATSGRTHLGRIDGVVRP